MPALRIGVFDSGIGGLSVANAIEKALPPADEVDVLFVNDSEHVPYGTKTPDEIYKYVLPIFQGLVDKKCDAIVVACNTVSTTLIHRLREQFSVPLIAMEPMVKPAAHLTKSGVLAVCATPATLASERYNWLKDTYANSITVLEPDCSDWATLIEANDMNEDKIRACIEPTLEQDADVIVLGCTHYHWIEEQIKTIAKDKAVVIQPEQAVIAQLKRVLKLPV